MKNTLKFNNQYIESHKNKIDIFSKNWDINKLANFFSDNYNIDSQLDQDIIKPFTRDWSNIPGGRADLLVRPKTAEQSAIILRTCKLQKIPITISAGQTNLTGSATPKGGIILSTSRLTTYPISVDVNNKSVRTSVGVPLEEMRDEVLRCSNNTLYYPVDPTSRHDAYVGGTLSCNASGFIPGEKGATRYWVKSLEVILINGYTIKAKRGEYISNNSSYYYTSGGCSSSTTQQIITNLFDGNKDLSEKDFYYCISGNLNSNTFKITAKNIITNCQVVRDEKNNVTYSNC